MNMKYEIKPLTEEEETFIEEKINVYGDSIAHRNLTQRKNSLFSKWRMKIKMSSAAAS